MFWNKKKKDKISTKISDGHLVGNASNDNSFPWYLFWMNNMDSGTSHDSGHFHTNHDIGLIDSGTSNDSGCSHDSGSSYDGGASNSCGGASSCGGSGGGY